MTDPTLGSIQKHGQSIWLDDLSRSLVRDGTLAELVDAGVSGVTSNPKILHEAITSSDVYDDEIDAAESTLSAADLYERLAVEDVSAASKVLEHVYESSNGTDGFVSLEVSPHLARETEATIREARRLWSTLDRPNVFIKIPGTAEGVPAVQACLEDGINVNVTLLFSVDRYRAVADAYLKALASKGDDAGACVASFFLSRIDTKVDAQIDALVERAPGTPADVVDLRGRTALALARTAYAFWDDTFGPRFGSARRPRPLHKLLWASTSTKDPSFPPTKYVDALVLPHTIDTVPRDTLETLRDPDVRRVRNAPVPLEEDKDVLRRIQEKVIDLNAVFEELEEEGVQKFLEPYDDLIRAIEQQRSEKSGAR